MTILPPRGLLGSLSASLRRANLEACRREIDRDLARCDAVLAASKLPIDKHPMSNWAYFEKSARDERRVILRRRRRLWALADEFGVSMGQPRKRASLSPAMLQLVRSARERYGNAKDAA